MDVGFYLSELLMQQGEVSVPGLGTFTQVRMSGYYNENEGVLYPPYQQVQFSPQAIDNDALAQYIADKKGISLASAQYFTEKYISGLKQQALTGEVAVGNIGRFYMDQSLLSFKSGDKIAANPSFYNYPPVKINKLVSNEVAEANTKTEPSYSPPEDVVEPIIIANPASEVIRPVEEHIDHEEHTSSDVFENEAQHVVPEIEYSVDVHENRETSRIWAILLISIIVIAAALLALYNYNPAAFNKLNLWQNTAGVITPVKPKPVAQPQTDTIKTDTAKIIKQDTSLKTSDIVKPLAPANQALADTAKKTRFEVIATSFKTEAMANTAIKNYKSIGIDAHIVTDAPGRRKKITVGTYLTRKEADAAREKLVAAGKIQKDAFLLPINPQP